jgi:two-component system sensor histidine kinase PilS (NtrC family)
MVNSVESNGYQYSETHWKSLRYFNFYRFCIAGMLFASALFHPSSLSILTPDRGIFNLAVTSLYLLATTVSLVGFHYYRKRFNMQLSLHVLTDILVLTLLIHTGGGLRSGLGAMMLVTLAGSGLVGQGRQVLFYAAMATLAVLFEQSFLAMKQDFETVDFFQAGLFSTGFFGVAISARLLAKRVIANEELARKRGVDLRNQTLISQRVIEEMHDGVLVLSRSGWVKQHNPRAEQLLGLGDPSERMLINYSTELAHCFADWCKYAVNESVLIRAPASGMQLRARFVSTDSSERDVLVFLEDMGRLQEQARQLKLAALGRLTANIAHEIRNPLSAINHAGELLQEESLGQSSARLLRIVLDNVQRVERIVSDVLELGRRDRTHRELVDLRQTLPVLVEEYAVKEKIATGVVAFEFSGVAKLCFDRSHLHQVLWNLLGNALRYSRNQEGSIRFQVYDAGPAGLVHLHVIDDGPGVDESHREQVFEPFFTTHSRGTGLGLYIARELCDANGAQLELLDNISGADFCISGRAVECQ